MDADRPDPAERDALPWPDAAPPEDLVQAVARCFGPEGPLAAQDPSYLERSGQQQMAAAVAEAITDQAVLVVEAGTGIGKTFAYLVPALLSGRRTLVSTATKSLQDQLYRRDLPALRDTLGLPLRTALLKGRGSYLCQHRLILARGEDSTADAATQRALARIETWAQGTPNGDLAGLPGLDERSPLLPLITSTRENCLGSDCPQFRECHVMQARREAMAADLVVVNHHLFFADLSLRDTGMAELLPSVELAIFDEAHQLAEAGVGFLGRNLGSAQALDLARDLLAAGLREARGLQPWAELAGRLDRAARDLRLAAAGPLAHRPPRGGSLKLRWEDRAEAPDFVEGLAALAAAAEAVQAALDTVSELAPDFPKLADRAQALSQAARAFGQPAETGRVRWIELGSLAMRLVDSPLDVREAMQGQLDAAPRAWVFTSATLGAEARLQWFTERTGLDDRARTLKLDSPFDYRQQARLHVPARFPRPNSPEHPAAVAALAARCALRLGGRSFVLTTTLRALQRIAEDLEAPLAEAGIALLVQGRLPKRQLLERFVAGEPALLVGSASFWEGIDVPGEALQCVVIDKLPFPPPSDPLVEARSRQLEAAGRSPFKDYFVAEAAVALKQGAGRLIRRESDCGLLVVADPRLAAPGYGRQLLSALPPMPRLDDLDEALDWLVDLTRPATRAC